VGTISKFAFGQAHGGARAMQTDSLFPYPVADTSAFIVWIDSSFNFSELGYSISFWHKFDTDTLNDLCTMQITVDSGNTWYTLGAGGLPTMGFYNYKGSKNNNVPNYLNTPLIWSGGQADWIQEQICVTFFGIKGIIVPKKLAFRFLFTSDSTQNNLAGWIIDDIRVSKANLIASVKNTMSEFTIAPNPVLQKQITIESANTLDGTFELFDILGKQIFTTPIAKKIKFPDYCKGLYYYTLNVKNSNQPLKGKLYIE
jgi:hypothetical protein